MLLKTLIYSSICLFLFSCAEAPIKRGYDGSVTNKNINMEQSGALKKKVALLPFFNDSPQGGDDLAIVASEELRRELFRTGQFILDPNLSKDLGSSKEIFAGGGVKLVTLARKAKMLGINMIAYGRIASARVKERTDEIGIVRKTKSLVEVQLELRIFHVDSNKEIYTQTLLGDTDDRTYRFFNMEGESRLTYRQELLRYGAQVAARRAVPEILELGTRLNWVGRVAKIIGTKVYINAGRESGLNLGDVLKVMTGGSEIFDPESGALLGTSQGEVKGTLEVIDFYSADGAICVLHSGGTVLEGDYVQLY